jgi:hypothetical protein
MHGVSSGASRLDELIDETFDELRKKHFGHKNDYYGLIFLERYLQIPRTEALNQIAFGGNDFGIDGFALDRDERHFRLFQFKNSASPAQFRQSMERINSQDLRTFATYLKTKSNMLKHSAHPSLY